MIYLLPIDEVFIPRYPQSVSEERTRALSAHFDGDEIKRLDTYLTNGVIDALKPGDVVVGNVNIFHACEVCKRGARLFHHAIDGRLREVEAHVICNTGIVNEPVVKRLVR